MILKKQIKQFSEKMHEQLDEIRELGEIERNRAGLSLQMESMVKDQAREYAGKEFGLEYARPLLVFSLQDLALRFPDDGNGEEPLTLPFQLAKCMAEQLLDDRVPQQLLQCMCDSGQVGRWLSHNWTLRAEAHQIAAAALTRWHQYWQSLQHGACNEASTC